MLVAFTRDDYHFDDHKVVVNAFSYHVDIFGKAFIYFCCHQNLSCIPVIMHEFFFCSFQGKRIWTPKNQGKVIGIIQCVVLTY